jgi:DNA polymerase-3 subunit delta'
LLFCGPAGCGKHTTGLALAAALNCENAPGEGCGTCGPCQKIDANRHPDVQTLEREGAARIIPIGTIRERVIPRLATPPHEARARVFLIEEATALQGPAANALLKTLEEPPQRTHFILATTSPDQLLPTIRSRCQRVSFAALPPDMRAELGDAESEEAAELRELASAMERAVDGRSWSLATLSVPRDRNRVALALELLARRYHAGAREAAMAGELERAALLGRRAIITLDGEAALTQNNAPGQLTLEQLLWRLRVAAPGERDHVRRPRPR